MTHERRTRVHDEDATPLDLPSEPGTVRTPPQRVGSDTKVPLEDRAWQREGTDAPDAADIEDPERQL